MKKIKDCFLKGMSNFVYSILLLHVFLKTKKQNILPLKENFLIITIAFNDPKIISIQNDHLKQNLKDGFDYIVADNSNNIKKSDDIRFFCIQNNISYIKIPRNILSNIRMSGSHGMALNWCYKNIIKKYKPAYFGFLDHDIFPIKPVKIVANIKNGFWGVIRTKKEKWWYLWPGFSFFEFKKIENYRLNFFPHHTGPNNSVFLDTGGSNYFTIFKNINKDNIKKPDNMLIDLTTKETLVLGADSSNAIEIIDGAWLHLRQISWRQECFDKINQLQEIIKVAQEM